MKNSVSEISLQAKRSYFGISLLPSVYKIYTGSIYTRLIGWIEEKYDFYQKRSLGLEKVDQQFLLLTTSVTYLF